MSRSDFAALAPNARRFRLVRASSEAEFAEAAEFRARVFEQRRQVRFDTALEACRDRAGHVFSLFDQRTLVATGRVLPFPSKWSSIAGFVRGLDASLADAEIGRVAALRSADAARYSLVLLTLGAEWLLENTELRRYVAYCHPALLEMYRAVGARDTGIRCEVPGRDTAHRVLAGTFVDVCGPPVLGVAV